MFFQTVSFFQFVNQKIQKILKDNENEFFIAYKDQMNKIQSEMRALKKKVTKTF